MVQKKKKLREEWMNISKEACRKGTEAHLTAEKLFYEIGEGKCEVLSESLYSSLKAFLESKNLLAAEQIIHSKKHGISGTIDLMTYENNKIILWDYKTNKKEIGEHTKSYGTYNKPINNIPKNEYYKYALQLSIYRYMLELWGYKVGELYLIHLQDELKRIEVPYLKKEVELIFNKRNINEDIYT